MVQRGMLDVVLSALGERGCKPMVTRVWSDKTNCGVAVDPIVDDVS